MKASVISTTAQSLIANLMVSDAIGPAPFHLACRTDIRDVLKVGNDASTGASVPSADRSTPECTRLLPYSQCQQAKITAWDDITRHGCVSSMDSFMRFKCCISWGDRLCARITDEMFTNTVTMYTLRKNEALCEARSRHIERLS